MGEQTIPPDFVAHWSVTGAPGAASRCGCEYRASPVAATGEAVLGREGPELEAQSAVGLVITLFEPATRTGALIHVAREDSLRDCHADLVRAVFTAFPQPRNVPRVGFVSSLELIEEYGGQLKGAKALIRSLAPGARLVDIIVAPAPMKRPTEASAGDRIGVAVRLDTRNGELHICDDHGQSRTLDLKS